MTRKPGWYWCWDPDIGWIPMEWRKQEVFKNWYGPGRHLVNEPYWGYAPDEEPWVLEENVGPYIPNPLETSRA